jgi:leucyl-tRNA synthetase
MSGYDFANIESKWQRYWQENSTFHQPNPGDPYFKAQPKLYVLDMFPYPSGAGLHVGHPEGYTATDIVCRYARMKGCNVLHPMGYDAFGLPAEQYAVEHGVHPRETTEQNIANIERQIKMFGFSYDWSRRVATTDVDYYRWTQWIFLQLYNSWFDPESNSARPISELINLLESGDLVVDITGQIHQPLPEQTFSAIVGMPDDEIKFAELSAEERREIIDSQRLAYMDEVPVNWCPALGTVLANEEVTNDGRSERGNHPVYRRALKQWMLRITAYAERLLADIETVDWPEPIKIMQRNWIGKSTGASVFFPLADDSEESIEIFTTRPDTLFGATYMVLAPEHPLVEAITLDAQRPAVEAYLDEAKKKSELERTAETKEKTGVFTGAYAVNPVNEEQIPIWVADYVMMGYGTGAIMAVPAHDERDFDFAQAFDLPIVPIIKRKDEAAPRYVGGLSGEAFARVYETWQANPEKFPNVRGLYFGGFWDVADDGACTFQPEDVSKQWMKNHPDTPKGFVVVGKDGMAELLHAAGFESKSQPFPLCITDLSDELELVDSGPINGLEPDDAKVKITEWIEENDLGQAAVNYKLRDWLFSRQRYWGEPFPIVHDVASGQIYPLAQDELPVTLPPMDDFSPTASDDPDQPPQPPLSKAVAWRLVAGAIMDDGSVRIEEDFPIRELFADGVDVDAAIQKILEAGTDGLAEAADLLAPATVTVDGHECDLRLFTRELNTMPQWAGSCWYYLRYLDPQNKDRFVDPAIERYWMGADNDKAGGVDLYVGGAEHAVLHLLYSRFWHKVLYDLGHVAKPEPFHKLFNQGMILSFAYKDSRGITIGPADIEMKDEGGEPAAYHATTGEKLNKVVAKMSKSLKNVVNPDEIIAQYGADTFRMYEMFMGPLEASKPWNTNDVPGIFRFLQRVWRMILGDKDNNIQPLLDDQTNADVEKALHRLIKKAGEDLEAMKFNTAIAAMMEFVNTVFKAGKISPAQAERLVLVLAPFAPHIAEELWQQLGHDNTLAYEPWPDYDEAMIVEDTVELPVQVNGKVRGRITVAADADEAAVLEAAQDEPNVAGSLEGKTIVKTIVVPGRLVNLVVK